jgi:N-terminal acetyltransferase B complex non-catalytic subunit
LQAFKIYIRSQSSQQTEKSAVLTHLESLAEKKVALSDLEDIDLYDDALDFILPEPGNTWAKLVGELRWQSVRALPKNEDLSLKCFQACLAKDDMEHAQQVFALQISFGAIFLLDSTGPDSEDL